MKTKPIKIRRTWTRKPQTQIVPNKKKPTRQKIKLSTQFYYKNYPEW